MANYRKSKSTVSTKSDQKELKPTSGLPLASISIKETKILLHFETQISNTGRPFRLSGMRKNLQVPEKWVNKEAKNHWVYEFKYLDEQGGYFSIEIDYNDNFYKLMKY
jgi:hypothetical protein